MAKNKNREVYAIETGHRPHMTGGGYHDSRPRRQRTRSSAKRAAIARGDW